MAEPWFDPIRWAWLPGTALGVIGGIWGSMAGLLARRNLSLVLGSLWVWFLASVALLVVSLVALSVGQPYGVWYGLLLPGALGTTLGGFFLVFLVPALRNANREAEEQRMQSQNLG